VTGGASKAGWSNTVGSNADGPNADGSNVDGSNAGTGLKSGIDPKAGKDGSGDGTILADAGNRVSLLRHLRDDDDEKGWDCSGSSASHPPSCYSPSDGQRARVAGSISLSAIVVGKGWSVCSARRSFDGNESCSDGVLWKMPPEATCTCILERD
jgi:hypothetical protein